MLYPEIFRGDVRRKSFLGLINVKNIEGNLKNVKNVFRQILITTGMYVKVKTHMEELNLNFEKTIAIFGSPKQIL